MSRKQSLDDIGNPKYKETRTKVWADVLSPSRAEVAAAGVRELKPAYLVKVHGCDYAGQTLVEVHGRRLTVYRTYAVGEVMELYVHDTRGESDGHKN